MKKVLVCILDKFADWEGAYTASLISSLGMGTFDVKTVSLTKEPVKSMGGFTVVPDYDIDSAPDDFEAVLLIGGMSWRQDSARGVEPLVFKALEKGKIVGGICDAAGFLATMGVLNDVAHTGNGVSDLQNWAGEKYTGSEKYLSQQAVRDGNIITANGTAPLEFAQEVLLALDICEKEKVEGWVKFYQLGYYNAPMPAM